jgi:two-component system nitrate/nitrite response regulator NarL
MVRGRVLLVAKNVLLREGLKHVLNADTLSVVGEEASPLAALTFLQSGGQHVDLIICDLDGSSDQDLVDFKSIVEAYPQIIVVILTAEAGTPEFEKAIEVGARSFLPATISGEALNLVLQLLLLGENLFTTAGEVSGHLRSPPRERASDIENLRGRLSPREDDILNLLETGEPNKVIARRLNIAEATVKVHVKSLLRKIDVENRTQAAIWAMNNPGGRRITGI